MHEDRHFDLKYLFQRMDEVELAGAFAKGRRNGTHDTLGRESREMNNESIRQDTCSVAG